MGVSEQFQVLVKNLRTTNDSTVSARRKAITKRLNLDFHSLDSNTSNSRFIGSYGRGTAIKGFSDVDLLFALPAKTYYKYDAYQSNGQSALLQEVRNSIRKTYPTSEVGGDGQVVVVKFSDGIIFEVLPAFLSTDKGIYIFPDSNSGGKWKTCKPILEIDSINEQNKLFDKKVKHLTRMMKSWKKQNDVKISGLLIETLVMDFMKNWNYNDKSYLYYDYMTRDFLEFLSTRNPEQNYWLAWGSNQHVYRKGPFEAKAKKSHKLAVEAIEATGNSYFYIAKGKWREIFGSNYEG